MVALRYLSETLNTFVNLALNLSMLVPLISNVQSTGKDYKGR